MRMRLTLVIVLAFSAMLPSVAKAAPPQPDVIKPFTLTTLKGDTYNNCYILKRAPESLTVLHDNGVTKISFRLLDDDWREKYRYDSTKAAEFVKQEKERTERLLATERQRQETLQAAAVAAVLANTTPPPAPASPPEQYYAQPSPLAQSYWPDSRSYLYYGSNHSRYRRSSYYGYDSYYYPSSYYYISPSTPVCKTPSYRPPTYMSRGASSRVSASSYRIGTPSVTRGSVGR